MEGSRHLALGVYSLPGVGNYSQDASERLDQVWQPAGLGIQQDNFEVERMVRQGEEGSKELELELELVLVLQ